MITLILRSLGLLVFAAGFVALVADGVRSLAADSLLLTSVAAAWATYDSASLGAFGAWVANRGSDTIWGMMRDTVLAWPAFAVVGVVGILLMLAGRRRRPRRTIA